MIIGYARCSTTDQNLDWQLDALEKCGCERIYQEKITGTKKERPELNRMLEALHEGDTVVVCELTRLSRSTRGRMGGRPATDPKKIQQALAMYDANNIPIKDILVTTGISRGTLYSYIKKRKAH